MQPEWLIPQRHSAFRQHTEIVIEEDAGLFYAELLAPGRVAHGESLMFNELDLRLRMTIGGKLVIQERLYSNPSRLWPLMASDGAPLFIGTAVIAFPGAAKQMVAAARQGMEPLTDCQLGISSISASTVCLRLAAKSSIPLRQGLRVLRESLAPILAPLQCAMRKL